MQLQQIKGDARIGTPMVNQLHKENQSTHPVIVSVCFVSFRVRVLFYDDHRRRDTGLGFIALPSGFNL